MKLGDFPNTKDEERQYERLLGPEWREAGQADVLDALARVRANVDQLEAEGKEHGYTATGE